MKENRENKPVLKYLAVLLSLVLTGCGTIGLAQESTFESAYETERKKNRQHRHIHQPAEVSLFP